MRLQGSSGKEGRWTELAFGHVAITPAYVHTRPLEGIQNEAASEKRRKMTRELSFVQELGAS